MLLELDDDGSYEISSGNPNYKWSKEDLDVLSGTWLYRQFPYVELRTKTHNNKYTFYMYFEISKYTEKDQISEIEKLKLTPVEPYSAVAGCAFEFGKRLSD